MTPLPPAKPALPRPPIDDPGAVFAPLGQDERILWSGGPRRWPGRRFLFRHAASVLLLAVATGILTMVVSGRMSWAASSPRAVYEIPTIPLARFTGTDLVMLFTQGFLFAQGALTLALGLSARSGRRYLVTTRRAAVVDAHIAYMFRFDIASVTAQGSRLRFGSGKPETVAARPGLGQGIATPAACFDELEDAPAVLAELRSALTPR